MNFEDMQFIAHTKTIVSIYPEPLKLQLDIGPTMAGGKTMYTVEGAPKGEFKTLPVADGFSAVIDYQNCQFVGKNPMTGVPENAEKIARELVRSWTTGAGSGPGQQPGIMMIQGREPNKQELAHLNNTQHACFEWLVLEARGFWTNKQPRNINEKHRIAGKWLGLHEEWIAEVGTGMDKGQCVECYSNLNDARATTCHVCHAKQPAKTATPIKASPVIIDEPFKTSAVNPLPPPIQSPAAHATR